MKLPEDKREKFRKPKGRLFQNSKKAFEYLESLDYEDIITVGDIVSAEFLKNGFKPDMMIVDFKVEQAASEENIRETIESYSISTVRVENPAGQITEELWKTIKTSETPVKIIVDGEEDLATLPAMIHAPRGSVVAYGQPRRGMVLIHVTEEKKKEFKELLELLNG